LGKKNIRLNPVRKYTARKNSAVVAITRKIGGLGRYGVRLPAATVTNK